MHTDLGPNAALIGEPGSRRRLSTPALLVDLDALQANIAAMAARAAPSGLALRPHAKAHKCTAVARRQLAAGAVGISCATLGEAEAMAAAGLPGILVTSPVTSPAMLARLGALVAGGTDLMVVADHPANVAALDGVAAGAGRRLRLLVDLDVGQRRTGCASVEDAVALAQAIGARPNLAFAGIQAYYGHLQQVPALADRRAAVAEQTARIRALTAALAAAGLAPGIVSGGGTGTALIDLGERVFTELQPGSYLFLDSCYGPLALDEGAAPFRPSLFVAASIVTANRPGLVICNAGLKALAADSGRPVPVAGAPAGATYRFMGDEHGAIELPAGAPDAPGPGAPVELLTSHCDPTVNLYDRFHAVRGDRLVEIWPIEARGR
jgi:D-serine deaminase-like pyridoxal phosphate-dependent protein